MEDEILIDTKVVRSTLRGIEIGKTIIAQQGGTYSGKTFGILTALALLMDENKRRWKIRVIGQSVPHLKDGAIDDFETILAGLGISFKENATDKEYRVGKSTIKFLSIDKMGKAKGAKFDITFINECNELQYEIVKQLMLRTNICTILDWNPSAEFWFHDKTLPNNQDGILFKRTTYLDNPSLSERKRKEIEALQFEDEQLWRVYGLGLNGKITGLIFKNVFYVSEFPEDCRKVAIGLDFGFTNDPTAAVMIGELHGELYGKLLFYETGLTNSDIAGKLKELGISKTMEIWADSAEPKSITEISRLGWNIQATSKGADSVNFGIDLLKKYKINITSDSIEWHKEAKRYKWKERDGVTLNEPIDKFNHAWDAARYYAIKMLQTEGRWRGPTVNDFSEYRQ